VSMVLLRLLELMRRSYQKTTVDNNFETIHADYPGVSGLYSDRESAWALDCNPPDAYRVAHHPALYPTDTSRRSQLAATRAPDL
jgi:hypothetical protein